VHHGVLDPGVEVLVKPFNYAALASRVRALLDR
jgi:DNA-binding response OmpR family regulator